MALFTKQKLSGSTDGKPIQITATASPGTTLHTAVAGASDFDEIWLYAINRGSVDYTLTIQWGDTVAASQIVQVIPYQAGLFLCVPGLLLQNAQIVRAFCTNNANVSISGFVNRITGV
jgi:hypothetical protein